jgi:hypothetical protein
MRVEEEVWGRERGEREMQKQNYKIIPAQWLEHWTSSVRLSVTTVLPVLNCCKECKGGALTN